MKNFNNRPISKIADEPESEAVDGTYAALQEVESNVWDSDLEDIVATLAMTNAEVRKTKNEELRSQLDAMASEFDDHRLHARENGMLCHMLMRYIAKTLKCDEIIITEKEYLASRKAGENTWFEDDGREYRVRFELGE